MSKPLPLYVTGMARSGSTLICRMLSAHKDVLVASDPYFPLYRSFRNAIIRHHRQPGAPLSFDPALPFQDYYFLDERIRLMDVIQEGDLHTPFDPAEWEAFYEASLARIQYECADLTPYLAELPGLTYKDIFDQGLKIIARGRRAEDRKWVGYKEVWTLEFFAPLARAYPEARFLIIMRDPRAIVASMLAMGQKDPSQAAHALSYCRHWRKYVAFWLRYQDDPLFKNRLLLVLYEQLVREPEKLARQMCDFLEVSYDPDMLDPDKYFDYPTGAVWPGNSSYVDTLKGISVNFTERWRTSLDPMALKMVDLVCGPDMKPLGYEPLTPDGDRWPATEALAYILKNDQEYCSWRSDLGDPQQDYGFELFRRALLALPEPPRDRGLIRRSFLFEVVFQRLREDWQSGHAPGVHALSSR